MGRQPNRRPKIYEGADGWWHCYLTVGKKPDGNLDRRHLRGKTATAVAEKIEALQASLRVGHVPEVGARASTGEWLDHWLTTIAARKVRASTLEGYESKVRHRLVPGLGHHPLVKLTADHVESYFVKLEQEVAPATALQIFRILSRALKVARQRGKIGHNPCDLVDPPSAEPAEPEPPTVEETRRILTAAADTRAPARWWIALGLGLRQGEALGLLRTDVNLDFDPPTLAVRKPIGRRKWRHGCEDPSACAAQRCKRKPCRPGCRRHKRTCPPPCRPGCTRHASTCPQRTGGGLVAGDPKSRKGRRVIPLPPPLVELLREHLAAQDAERATAARWYDHGLVFAQPNGKPIHPRADWGAWKELLRAAGVADYRLHDARHGTATTWLEAGLDERVVMELLGHSQISMTRRYQHVRAAFLRTAAAQMTGALELVQPERATTRRLRVVE